MGGEYSEFECFPSDWTLCRVGEFANVKGGKRLPAGTSLIPYRTSHPYLRIVDFRDGRIDKSALLYVPDEVFPRIARYTITSKDIYISIVGSIGLVGVIDDELDGASLTENAAKICNIAPHVDREYLTAFLRSDWGQRQIRALTVGSTQPKLALFRIADILVPVPPLPEQRAISHILGTLDDKIEVNRKMSQTLEEMARAIFKSWFVDFDPVRAKAAVRREHPNWTNAQVSRAAIERSRGRMPLQPEIAELFPDRLLDSELGEIPEGWEVMKLGDLIELAYGRALKSEDRHDGSIPVYGSNGQVGWHDERIFPGPGIVVGRKGNPGIVTWAPTDFFVSDTAFYVVPKGPCHSLRFLFHALRTHDLASLSADSAVPGLNRNLAYMSPQLLPPSPILKNFDSITRVLDERIYACSGESRTLASIRDALLPKLISGEIRVKDAERFLKERGI